MLKTGLRRVRAVKVTKAKVAVVRKRKNTICKIISEGAFEREGFSDYFTQECRAVQQLDGRGIYR